MFPDILLYFLALHSTYNLQNVRLSLLIISSFLNLQYGGGRKKGCDSDASVIHTD
jgi:hypothetical protein